MIDSKTMVFSGKDRNTLFYAVIGLAALSGVLLLLLIGVVYIICKMWSTARNAIKKDVNPLYGADYGGQGQERRPAANQH